MSTTDPDPEPIRNPFAGDNALTQRVLMDFDIRDPTKQVLDSRPCDLTGIPMEAVHTYFTKELTITVYAHEGDGQTVADLLAARPDLPQMIVGHAQLHAEAEIDAFSLVALTEEEVERYTRILNESGEPHCLQ